MCLLPTHSSQTVAFLFPLELHHYYSLWKTAYKDVLGAIRKLNLAHEQCYTMKNKEHSKGSNYATTRNNSLSWIVKIK
jgi:hypothetical protein